MLHQQKILEDLGAKGYCVQSDAFSAAELETLRRDYERLAPGFTSAGIGRNAHKAQDVRRDRIGWLTPGDGCPTLWSRLEELKTGLNRTLYLGLWDTEGHFAHYAPGGFYSRHLDRFNDLDTRVISIVLYLTRDWSPGDGGELRLFGVTDGVADKPFVVEPRAGTMVIFMSGEIEHEVALAHRDRQSFAGWMRRRREP